MIGVMVACVPEGLQVTVSTALALGVMRMAKRNVLVKRLSAVETLGGATVICTDKTGTITKGEMTVREIWLNGRLVKVSGEGYEPTGTFTVDEREPTQEEYMNLHQLLEIAGLCNNSKVVPPTDVAAQWDIIGDPTDGSLLIAALKLGLNIERILAEKPRVAMIPFDSVRKRMSVVHRVNGKLVAYVKGAPKETLSVCTRILEGSTVQPLDQRRIDEVNAWKRRFGDEGLRVIAIAYRELPTDITEYTVETVERGLVFVGLVGIADPPRPEVREAVAKVKQAGVKVILITGDYGPTALAVAREAGIVEGPDAKVLTGAQVDQLSDVELLEELRRPEVIFARASPEHKMRIVSLLKSMGEVVAATGDGANDAPSLKAADIGVAMGLSGTDVARESADMILLNDSFASIVNGIEEGRTIYENIKKFTVYVFAHNWAELIPYLLFVLTGIPLPLLPTQVLAIDLGVDVAPSLALSVDPPEPGIMSRPPRSRKERVFNLATMGRSLFLGFFISLGALLGCLSVWIQGGWRPGQPLGLDDPLYRLGTTMTFAGIVLGQVGNVFALRATRVSVLKTRPPANRWIWVGVASQITIAAAVVYVPSSKGSSAPLLSTQRTGPSCSCSPSCPYSQRRLASTSPTAGQPCRRLRSTCLRMSGERPPRSF
ncbi:MAG: cation-transporting P-type ATPase [Candidatus Bathyarchaeia archaeon]